MSGRPLPRSGGGRRRLRDASEVPRLAVRLDEEQVEPIAEAAERLNGS